MAELVLMEKAGARMNVPADKLQEYLDGGWKEISREALADAEAAKEEAPPEDAAADAEAAKEEAPPEDESASADKKGASKKTAKGKGA